MFLSESFEFVPRKLTRLQSISNTTDIYINSDGSCLNNPDFATICGFFQKFSRAVDLLAPSFRDLLNWLDDSNEVPSGFQELIIQLFGRNGETVPKRNFEHKVAVYCAKYSTQDASEIEANGFQSLSKKQKLHFLKELVESLFVTNCKLQRYVEKQTAEDLRMQPLGSDRCKNMYLLRQNSVGTWCIYRQDINGRESCIVINRKQILELISKLDKALNITTDMSSDRDIRKSRSHAFIHLLIKEEQQLLIFLKALSATLFLN